MITFADLGVLYVEDDPHSRAIMHLLLVDMLGISKVAIFEDSANFENRLSQLSFQPDIIFLDIQMKPVDGFHLLSILRKLPAYVTLPIAAVTASVMNEKIAQLKAAGFNGVLPKTIQLETFEDTLQRLLSGEQVWRVV
jgi:CheY-like chemotaxis protein